mgnify:CR=1 FL=1
MKRSDLKKVIKPLVKECIQEVLLEEGLLSNIVSEVVQGIQGNLIVEKKQERRPSPTPAVLKEEIDHTAEIKAKRIAQRKQLMDSIGGEAYNGVNLFEGTEPMPSQGTTTAGTVDLGNPTDSGVDISSFAGAASKMWNLINKDTR